MRSSRPSCEENALSSVNFAAKEISLKIVYYGPGLGGKTTSLCYLHHILKKEVRGELITLPTAGDRTILFDFLPLKLKSAQGFTVRVYLYTVPGQVHYNATRKLVLAGADGVVFVADSQRARAEANQESLEDLHENLFEQGLDPTTLPMVLQLNKRDLPDVMSVAELGAQLNADGRLASFETSAVKGRGVVDALRAITRRTLTRLQKSGVFATQPRADLSPPSSLFGEPPSEGLGEQIARYAAMIASGGSEGEPGSGSGPRPDAVQGPAPDGFAALSALPALPEPGAPAAAPPPAASGSVPPLPAAVPSLPGGPVRPSIIAAPPLAPPLRLVGRDDAEPPRFSFAVLWSEAGARTAAREAERALAEGDFRRAVVAASEILRATLDETGFPGARDGSSELDRGRLLGLDGRDWLRFRAITVRAAGRNAEVVSNGEALFAFHFAVGARLRALELLGR